MIYNFSRKLIACSKLNLPPPPPFVLSFNPMQYSTIGTSNLKEASYSSAELGRGSYLSSILDTLTGADIRVLVKFLEEASQATENQPSPSCSFVQMFTSNVQAVKFKRVFPTVSSHKYFKFMEQLCYNDKLMDAFEHKFGDNIQMGVDFVEAYCRNNAHI